MTAIAKKINKIRRQIASLADSLESIELEAMESAPVEPRTETPTEMVTLHEFAEITGVHYNTVRRWVSNGVLKPYVLGTKRYFLRGEIPALLRQMEANQ